MSTSVQSLHTALPLQVVNASRSAESSSESQLCDRFAPDRGDPMTESNEQQTSISQAAETAEIYWFPVLIHPLCPSDKTFAIESVTSNMDPVSTMGFDW